MSDSILNRVVPDTDLAGYPSAGYQAAVSNSILNRVVTDSDLAGYPANNFAGYPSSGYAAAGYLARSDTG